MELVKPQDGLPCPLVWAMKTRWMLERGHSLRFSLQQLLLHHNDDFALDIRTLLMPGSGSVDVETHSPSLQRSAHRRALLLVFAKGLQGLPILDKLSDLEQELSEAALLSLEKHVLDLPYKVLIPIMLFQLPAFLILLFAPIFFHFVAAFR